MSNDIRARLTGVHAIGRVGSGTGGGAGAAMNALAQRVSAQIAGALDLAGRDGDPRHGRDVMPEDLYEVEREADALAAATGIGPAERVRLALALHAFTEACAAELAARPAAFTIERIQAAANAAAGAQGGTADAIATIERATAMIGAGR